MESQQAFPKARKAVRFLQSLMAQAERCRSEISLSFPIEFAPVTAAVDLDIDPHSQPIHEYAG